MFYICDYTVGLESRAKDGDSQGRGPYGITVQWALASFRGCLFLVEPRLRGEPRRPALLRRVARAAACLRSY
jgi:hypothetical protein